MPLTFDELVRLFGDCLPKISDLHLENPPPNEAVAAKIAQQLECQCHHAMDAMRAVTEEPSIGADSELAPDVQQFIHFLEQCEAIVGEIEARGDITSPGDRKTIEVARAHARMRIAILQKRIREEENNRNFIRLAMAQTAPGSSVLAVEP